MPAGIMTRREIMSLSILGALICTIIFLTVLSSSKIPNFVAFFLMAPVAIYSGLLEVSDVTSRFSQNAVHLLMVIGMFSSLLGMAHVDVPISNFLAKVTGSYKGKNVETVLLGVFIIMAGFFSWFLQNNYLTLSLLPVMFAMSKKYNISHSKIIMMAMYATTLGGSCTLIGTNTNTYATAILEGAGYAPLKFFDFVYTGLPCLLLGAVFMVMAHKIFPDYKGEELPEEYRGEIDTTKALTPEEHKRMVATTAAFLAFVASLIIASSTDIKIQPAIFGYGMMGLLMLFKIYTPKELIKTASPNFLFQVAGTLTFVQVISKSGISDYIGGIIANALAGQTNMYIISAILFFGTLILTSLIANSTCVQLLGPIAITVAEALGANPTAFILTVAVASSCSFLTPMASATNYMLIPYTNLQFKDFIKAGIPLAIMNALACIFLLPQFFPYF